MLSFPDYDIRPFVERLLKKLGRCACLNQRQRLTRAHLASAHFLVSQRSNFFGKQKVEHLFFRMDDAATNLLSACAHKLITAAMNSLAIMVRSGYPQEQAALACVESLRQFPDDYNLTLRAFQALLLVWVPSLSDHHILAAVLDGMAMHRSAIRLGLDLLRFHVAGPNQLILAPKVLVAVNRVMCCNTDNMTRHIASMVLCMLNGIEPDEYVSAHGEFNYDHLKRTSIELAIVAATPVTLLVRGVPWNVKMLQLFPRLRSQDQ